jgi:hypothetical protein
MMKRTQLGVTAFGLTAVLLTMAPSFAQANLPEASPELFTNGVPNSGSLVEVAGYGQILLRSEALPGSEIECVNLAFGTGHQEPAPPAVLSRPHGQVLSWAANGHRTEFNHTENSSKCRGLSGSGWAVDEPPIGGGEGVIITRGPVVSTPWNMVAVCGEREEERTGVVQIGYPTGEEPPVHACKTQAAEESEMSTERTSHLHCFKEEEGKAVDEPAGCINVTIVDPTAGLEIRYGGSLRPKWTNGAGTGLNASKWIWEGIASNELFCQLSGCHSPGTTTGQVKIVGFEAQELIQVR